MKGKDYFDYPNKYYCEDIGLQNTRIGFRQQEMAHIMENILYNELVIRECAVDVGIVYLNEKDEKGKINRVAREIDFIAAFAERGFIFNLFMRFQQKKRQKPKTSLFL